MLSTFDWIRRSESGIELLATLDVLKKKPYLFESITQIGPPHFALNGPCQRCWVYPRYFQPGKRHKYCRICAAILKHKAPFVKLSPKCAIIWGYLNDIPDTLRQEILGETSSFFVAGYIHDRQSFLLILPKIKLGRWLREFVIYYGAQLRGQLQVFPTVGSGHRYTLADLLTRIIHYQSNLPMNALYVRFYPNIASILRPKEREQAGLLTFEISDFLSFLETAKIFRTIFLPHQQDELYDLLNLKKTSEEQFYWGRFVGELSKEAKDLLSAWDIRKWPKEKIQLLYELKNYAEFDKSH